MCEFVVVVDCVWKMMGVSVSVDDWMLIVGVEGVKMVVGGGNVSDFVKVCLIVYSSANARRRMMW